MYDICKDILAKLKKYNKEDICDFDYHYNIIKSYVDKHMPIQAIIPAFPGKAINPNLCPSNMPDGAEEYALNILKQITTEIKKIYKPGIHIKIFHDGYYFIPLGMDYDYYRMQEYVDIIKKMCKGFSISSIDMKETSEGTTFEARLNYWMFKNLPPEEDVKNYIENNSNLILGLSAFFYNNYSEYLYPMESTYFRKKISKFITQKYIAINLSVQQYIAKFYSDHLRFSVKQQRDANSKKLYIDILHGIENEGLPWMNTLVCEGNKSVIKKFRKD